VSRSPLGSLERRKGLDVDAWLAGVIGGLLGTVALTVLVMPTMRDESPLPSLLLARALGGDADGQALRMAGMAGHFAYGAIAGLVFGVVIGGLVGAAIVLWVLGLLFGAALLLTAIVGWGPLLDLRARLEALSASDRHARVVGLAAGHLAYGLVLGIVVSILV
jgi:hypothetical protein